MFKYLKHQFRLRDLNKNEKNFNSAWLVGQKRFLGMLNAIMPFYIRFK